MKNNLNFFALVVDICTVHIWRLTVKAISNVHNRRMVIILVAILVSCGSTLYAKNPATHMDIPVSKDRMYADVKFLTDIRPYRNAGNIQSLNKAAEYVLGEFGKTGCRAEVQRLTSKGREYKNVVCSFGPEEGNRIIVGAHYDVYGDQPGADDNASGVAGLLELARLVGTVKPDLKYRTDFVAFTLEEPQYFRTRHMGSHVYAKSLYETGVKARAMIALEMIGYFTDSPKSQRYPLPFLKWFYPDKGNYIAVVGKWRQGNLAGEVQKSMRAASKVPVESIAAPAFIPGIDFSDHQSFWRFGYKAVMITDTAFYRNHNYHKPTDTIGTLDFDKMSEVARGLYWTIVSL
jgi:hypothetical protein